jgi:CHASE2 domain-containing sensor protein
MKLAWDTMYFVNLVLCIIILILGIVGWRRSGKTLPIFIGVAFGLFGLSHLAILLDLKDSLDPLLIVIRTAAYVLVALALYLVAFQTKREAPAGSADS